MSAAAAAADDYDRLLAERHFASTVEGLATAHRRHAMHYPDGRRWCTVLRPGLVDRAVCGNAMVAARVVSRAIGEITERVLADRRLRAAIGLPSYLDAALEIDRESGNASLLARLDGFLVDGEARFIEYNAEPGGMASSREVELAFGALPIAAEFAGVHPFAWRDNAELAIDAVWRDFDRWGRDGVPAIAVMRTTASLVQGPMLRWLPYAASRGCLVFSVRPEEMEIAGDGVSVEGRRVDYLAFRDWGAVFEPSDAMRRVLGCVSRGDVRTLNGISRVVAATSKVLLEVLTSSAHARWFDRETAATLARHVPWTRWLRDGRTDHEGSEVELLRFVETRRRDLVLKPANAKGGQGLVIGAECDDAAWRAALEAALRRPSVVQWWIEPPRQWFPVAGADGALTREALRWDFNPYVWNGDVAEGALIRASQDSNLSAGRGSVVPLWILDR